jgi:hypothetical protein
MFICSPEEAFVAAGEEVEEVDMGIRSRKREPVGKIYM